MQKATYQYNYNYGLPSHIVVEGIPVGEQGFRIGAEMNIISKYIWGLGAAMNSVYNAHGALVKFQSDVTTNKRRAKLLTKIWRYCKKNNIIIATRHFPRRNNKNPKTPFTENYNELIHIITKAKKDEL